LALPIAGDSGSGAAIVLAMTTAGRRRGTGRPSRAKQERDLFPESTRGHENAGTRGRCDIGGGGSLLHLSPRFACHMANSAVASSIEIGAVSLAMTYGFSPEMGFIFAVALCVASVGGGM